MCVRSRRLGSAPALAVAVAAWGYDPTAHAQVTTPRTGSPSGSEEPVGGAGKVPARAVLDERDLVSPPPSFRTLARAPTLPDLTHRVYEGSFEHTLASVRPSGAVDRLASHLFHVDFEVPLSRVLYIGAQYGFAAARSPASPDARFISGQPDLFARAVYVSPGERYALGAGLGVIPPIVTYDDLDDQRRSETATTSSLVGIVRPWDISSFLDRRVTMRPWIDLRVVWHTLVLQVRQGLDAAIRSGVPSETSGVAPFRGKVGDFEVTSVTTAYLGFQPTREVALGVEAWEVYLLRTQRPVSDRDRVVFALSPGIRFFYRYVEPGVSVLFPVGDPLLGSVGGYLALRLDLRIWFGGGG